MRDKEWRTIIYVVLILLLWSCSSCSVFAPKPPPPVPVSCDQLSIDRTIFSARKAGCKRYKVEKDEFLQTCTFICYESK